MVDHLEKLDSPLPADANEFMQLLYAQDTSRRERLKREILKELEDAYAILHSTLVSKGSVFTLQNCASALSR